MEEQKKLKIQEEDFGYGNRDEPNEDEFAFENENKYLLEFIRRGGVIPQYYQNFLIIKEIIEKELNEKNEGNEESDENNENNNNLKENILKL